MQGNQQAKLNLMQNLERKVSSNPIMNNEFYIIKQNKNINI